jgi:hypothetical protein
MKTSIEHIRAKITELEARITDLRIAERELEAPGAVSAPRGKLKAKAKPSVPMMMRQTPAGSLPLGA